MLSGTYYHNELVTVEHSTGVFMFYGVSANYGKMYLAPSPGNVEAERLCSQSKYGLIEVAANAVRPYIVRKETKHDRTQGTRRQARRQARR